MDDTKIIERRRLLQLVALGAFAAPIAALAGCASGTAGDTPRRRPHSGGGSHGDKGNGGGKGNGGRG